MNIIFFTCIFVIEQVYQNKLSTKATGLGCSDWNRPFLTPQVFPQPRLPPTAALGWQEAASAPPAWGRSVSTGNAVTRRTRTAAGPLGRKGRVSAGRCLDLMRLRGLGGSDRKSVV